MRTNLGLFLAKRAQLSPSVEALVEVERGRRFTYAELEARACRAANALAAQGVRRGDRVALLLMNGVEYLESYFAIAKLGAVLVPLNWRLVPDELAFIVKDAGATALLFDAEFDDAVRALRERDTGIRTWLRAGGDAPAPALGAAWDDLVREAPSAPPAIEGGDDDMLFIMYTSGTTGLPKGVVHTHATVAAACITVNLTADMRYRDRYLQMLPLFHVGALTPAVSCVHRGGTLVLLRAFDPSRAWDVIEAERVTTGLAVPAMLQFMWLSPRRGSADTSSLRWLMSGAAPVPVPVIEQYAAAGIEIHQVYGLTESGGPACLIGPEQAIAKAGSTGPAFFHTDVRVVDEAGRDVAAGAVGEVWIRGAHVMKEYWNRPDATAEAIVDGWLRSGDLATVDKEGFVYIQDRKKDMIISGGENVYPAEIESVLAGHPKLAECAVIGQPSARWGESPAAIVVQRPGESATPDEIVDFCRGKLARYKVPRVVEFVDAIPRNPTGKILKRVLRERFPGPAPD
ncbi:MAG: 2-succinylbenzoyl-CoA synthetase [Proteobacteria bacterium]|nr:MAG: 2-succinylbenzoyl-CoA synthetase [Pseudomonadota bacterium]